MLHIDGAVNQNQLFFNSHTNATAKTPYMQMAGRMVEKSGGVCVVVADIACPKITSGTNNPATHPCRIVKIPKMIRPVERSL